MIMKLLNTTQAFLIILLLFVVSCEKQDEDPSSGLEGSSNSTNYGSPYKITYPTYHWFAKWVTFGIITDSHIDASNCSWAPWGGGHPYRDTPRVLKNRKVIHSMNYYGAEAGCGFYMHLGDMVDDNNVQNLVAWRQHYESNYPGYDGGSIAGASDDDYDAYSQGYRISKPVFPGLGNHDAPPYSDDPEDWNYAAEYIRARVQDSTVVSDYFGYGAYALRVGQYYFIQLGLWAGSHDQDGNTYQDKLDWLKDYLANHVGESNLGVVIFQHYCFNDEDRWWTSSQKELELNILCRRESSSEPARPYNVLGIFSGHQHTQYRDTVYAGTDKNGKEVNFLNYIMDDACGGNDKYGFNILTLTGTELRIHHRDVYTNTNGYYTKDISIGLPPPAPCPGTPTVEYEGKTYNTVQIGKQCWLKENLNVGTMIPGMQNAQQGNGPEKYCYNDNETNCDTDGGLYQWDELMSYSTTEGARGICPHGWHVPTKEEFHTLRVTAGWVGNELKAKGQGYGDGAGTDRTGFSAQLTGYRAADGGFADKGERTLFFTSKQYGDDKAWRVRLLDNDYSVDESSNYKNLGFSVRCIKDD